MTAALSKEPNVETRKSIEFSLRLLKDGYILEQESDGTVRVIVRTARGGCTSKSFSAEQVREKGIELIVAEFQEKCQATVSRIRS